MKKLKMKARAGVTLVELLVVILIVTILSVSLLPMFKEYICKAQYAAEAIPVIGNLRTKIGLYQYDNSKLPANPSADANVESYMVSSWEYNTSDSEKFVLANYAIDSFSPVFTDQELSADNLIDTKKTPLDYSTLGGDGSAKPAIHLGHSSRLDIDYQDLKGKRSKPIDYVYYKIPCSKPTDSAYVVGCFGAGHGGFAEGTGYAVCEFNFVSAGKKYIGTFERYKAKDKENGGTCPYLYLSSDTSLTDDGSPSGNFVYCPKEITDDYSQTDGVPQIITDMQLRGWKFQD